MGLWRSRWAAVGAAVAVTLGAGGIGLTGAGAANSPVVVTIEPVRILDTRVGLGLAGRFVNEQPRELQVSGEVFVAPSGTATVVPEGAAAVMVNVTVVLPDSRGYLTLRPSGSTEPPATSTVNFFEGTIEPNAATVDLTSEGSLQVYLKTAATDGSADVLIDVVGYTVDHAHDDRYYTRDQVEDLMEAAVNAVEPGVVPFHVGIEVGQTQTIGSVGPISFELECTNPIGDVHTARILGRNDEGIAFMTPNLQGGNDWLEPGTADAEREVDVVSTNVPWFENIDMPSSIFTHAGHHLALGTETMLGVFPYGDHCVAVGMLTRIEPAG